MGILIVLLGACTPIIPATTPPQLQHTPGSPITIVDNRITTETFYLTVPDGWRVITSVANAPLELVIVSPDDELIVRVAQVSAECELLEMTPDATRYTTQQCIGGEIQLRFLGEAPVDQQAIIDPYLTAVIDSVVFR